MLRQLAFLAATVYLAKKGYDTLIAAQNQAANAAPAEKPLNPVIPPEVADQIRGANVLASAVEVR